MSPLLNFEALPRVYVDQYLWGTHAGIFSFIISWDKEDLFYASAKLAGSKPFQGERFDLGNFPTYDAAVAACEAFLKEKQQ